MNTIEERLADARAELARQQAVWEGARTSAEKQGNTPRRVPVASLTALDALVRRVQLTAGAIAV
jgi:hypothetical protein